MSDKQDFYVEQDNYGLFDLTVDEDTHDFTSVAGMETAVSVQLFTDKRVSKQDISKPLERKGWVGDMLSRTEDSYQIGSLLHLKAQARNIKSENNETAAYAKNALNYFVDLGAAKKVTADIVGVNVEGEIQIDADKTLKYSKLWRNTNGT
jgi:phage gp46-like protein